MAKIFLVWADKGPKFRKFMEDLIKPGHQIVYWIGSPGGEKDKLPGTIFHNHFQAWDAKPSPEISDSFDPPSKDLLDRIQPTELTVLPMMNKHFDTSPVDERRHIYYQMVGYWYGVLKKFKPDLIVYPAIPHTVYNYVISELAKLLGIRQSMLEDPWVANRILVYNDWIVGNQKLVELAEKNKNKQIPLKNLSPDIRDYYLSQISSPRSEPEYMGFYRKQFGKWPGIIKHKAKILKESILRGDVFQKLLGKIIKQFKSNLKKEYEEVVDNNPDLNKPFIYAPLGFQPERVTSPQGGVFVDQILMIETLSTSLPPGWSIYVKEHPGQWWLRSGVQYSSSRYRGYYRRIARIKNVKLVPIDSNSLSLIEESKAVATVTGTAGWEAILRLKPALIFGYPWYRDFPYIFKVDGAEACRKALAEIQAGFKFREKDVINYLKAFDEATVFGYLEYVPGRKLDLTFEQSLTNVAKVILSELLSLKSAQDVNIAGNS